MQFRNLNSLSHKLKIINRFYNFQLVNYFYKRVRIEIHLPSS